MKKIQNLLIVCGLVLAGCSETPVDTDGLPQPAPVKRVSLRIAAGTDTRAELGEDLRVKFQPGDMIDINGEPYEVFLLDDGSAAVPGVVEAQRYEAVFPSACNFLQQTKETANFKLPLAQFYAGPGTFGRNAMPMHGEATGIDEDKGYVNVTLHNMCGVLKLTLKGSATINTILVEDKSGAPISGYATLETDSEGNKILVPGTASSARAYHLVLNCGGSGQGVALSEAGTDFYVVMPARAYAAGLKIRITDRSHRAMTLDSPTPRTIKRNVVTETPAITYAPDADLVFAEYFDACTWGGNYVGNTKGYSPSQTGKQQADGSLAGTTAAGSATGLEEAPFYVMENAAGTADYSNSWNIVPPSAVNNVTADYIRNRNLYDWTYLYRCAEFQGCLRVGSPTLGRGKIHTPKLANIPAGNTRKAQITFRLCYVKGANMTDRFQSWIDKGTYEEVYIDGAKMAFTPATSAYIPNSTIGTDGWAEVKLIAGGVSKDTSFNFFEEKGTAAPTSYYFVDDIEVRLLD